MKTIEVQTKINATVQEVWQFWTSPEHITGWNFASDTWQCPKALNDLKPGGKFIWRMEAKDGSMGFDYSGTYQRINDFELIEMQLDDGRNVRITFIEKEGITAVTETFEPDENDQDLQKQGWQSILDNFRKYVESN